MTVAERIEVAAQAADLTYEEIAAIVDTSPRSVQRWAAGRAAPRSMSRQALTELAYVAEHLGEVLEPQERNLWMHSPNRLLDHDSPADRIREGDYRSVMALIDALADGVVV